MENIPGSQEVTSSSLVCSTFVRVLKINGLYVDSQDFFFVYTQSLFLAYVDFIRLFRTFRDVIGRIFHQCFTKFGMADARMASCFGVHA